MTSESQRRNEATETAVAGAENAVPTGAGEFSASLDVSTVAPRRRVGFGTLVLATTACVSALSLYTMRIVGTAGADDGTTEAGLLVESFLKERGGRASASAGRTDLLDPEASTRLQIPAEELLRNPFDSGAASGVSGMASGGGSATPDPAEAPLVDPAAEAIAIWTMNAESGIAEIRVHSAMVSSRAKHSLANVNGRVLRVGDAVTADGVGMTYRLHEIGRGEIVLEARDESLGTQRFFSIPVTAGK